MGFAGFLIPGARASTELNWTRCQLRSSHSFTHLLIKHTRTSTRWATRGSKLARLHSGETPQGMVLHLANGHHGNGQECVRAYSQSNCSSAPGLTKSPITDDGQASSSTGLSMRKSHFGILCSHTSGQRYDWTNRMRRYRYMLVRGGSCVLEVVTTRNPGRF